MGTLLRENLETLDIGSAGFLLIDPATGDRYRFGEEERRLIDWLDEGCDPEEIIVRYRDHFGREVSKRRIREFVSQLDQLGLLGRSSEPAAESRASVRSAEVGSAEPLSGADAGSGVNHAYDLLVVLCGWMLHPVMLLPVLGLALIAVHGLAEGFGRYRAELIALWHSAPLATPVMVVLVRFACLSLPRELLVGMAARRFGGRVRSLSVRFVHGLLPTFVCDVGDCAALWSGRPKWTLLTIRFWAHVLIGSVAGVGWLMASPRSNMGTFWMLLLIPSVVGGVLQLNVFMPLDGYTVLVHVLKVPGLRRRALAETSAWLGFRNPPEPLTDSERFWFRVYGMGVYAWRCLAYALIVGGGGWLLVRRFGGTGAMVGTALLFRWHQELISETIMEQNAFRWIVRGGGRWWLRWSVRLAVVGGMVAAGFAPYDQEVSGECRIIPVAEQGVRTEIAGTIDRILVSQGDWVEQGAVIATLTARIERANVAMTEAELARAKAQLALLRAGSWPEEITAAAEEVKLRQIQLDYSNAELRRVEQIAETDAAAEIELIRARDTRDGAKQMLRIAQEVFQRIEKGARDEKIQAAEAEVERLEAQLAYHKELLVLREIRAPISGRITTFNVAQRRGQYLQPGDLIAVLKDNSRLRAEVLVPEAVALSVDPGQQVNMRLRGLDGRLFTGRVDSVLPYVGEYTQLNIERFRSDRESLLEDAIQDNREGYVRVYVEMDAPDDGLLAGMGGYARIVVRQDRLWRAVVRPFLRFFRVEVWSWLP